ncbi:MAG: HAMP domain-containing histidine kinase [bacterium]|nr:HAMP domain-containing histidine kinase [bacterium]
MSIAVRRRSPAYVLLGPDARVVEAGGELARYGLRDLAVGDDVTARADFLAGMLPASDETIELPALTVGEGQHADVHIGVADGTTFVLLFDATARVMRQSALQQKGNDLDLLRGRTVRAAGPLPADHLVDAANVNLRRVAVVRVHLILVGEDEDEPVLDSTRVVETRRAQRLVREELRRQAGLTLETGAAEACAAFGLLSTTGVPERQAIDAARAVLAIVGLIPGVAACIGVASGAVAASEPTSDAVPIVIGPPFDHALRLALLVGPGCVLADDETVTHTQGLERDFVGWTGSQTGPGPLFVRRGNPPRHGELAGVLSALGVVLLEVRQDGILFPTGVVPDWADALLEWEGRASGGLRPADELSFLANFLVDAAEFWDRGEVGFQRSGIWTELDEGGENQAFEALALVGSGGERLLALDFLSEAYTERQELLQQARETRLSFEALQAEIQKKDVLLHCIVHDLKAPLSSIVGALSLLNTRELAPDKVASLLEIGLRQAQRQEDLIRQVLDVFAAEIRELESFESDPRRAPDLSQCLRDAVDSYRPAYQDADVELTLDATEGEMRVVGVADRLERAIANLLENALRYSPAGTRTEVAVENEDGHVRVTISDRGPGVDPEVAEKLFDRFVRGSAGGSSGLGLYYCRITLRSWGGSVGYEPRPGGGSVFWLRLVRAL